MPLDAEAGAFISRWLAKASHIKPDEDMADYFDEPWGVPIGKSMYCRSVARGGFMPWKLADAMDSRKTEPHQLRKSLLW
jgi:hypothetical protein